MISGVPILKHFRVVQDQAIFFDGTSLQLKWTEKLSIFLYSMKDQRSNDVFMLLELFDYNFCFFFIFFLLISCKTYVVILIRIILASWY